MHRCPICTARLDTYYCGRCGTDFRQILAVRQSARQWLRLSIKLWQEDLFEQSFFAIKQAEQLHNTRLTSFLSKYFIDQQCRRIAACLKENRILQAKRFMHQMRKQNEGNAVLIRMNEYLDYLLTVKSTT